MSPKTILSSLLNDEDSQDSINENVPSSSSTKIHTMECDTHGNIFDLTLDDIRLLVELFYLPYENGSNVQQIYLNFSWLRFNSNRQKNVKQSQLIYFHLIRFCFS
jgi:hypothetical protein